MAALVLLERGGNGTAGLGTSSGVLFDTIVQDTGSSIRMTRACPLRVESMPSFYFFGSHLLRMWGIKWLAHCWYAVVVPSLFI